MNHPILDMHTAIAWDMDQTLIKGPNSDFFRRYIMTNPEKTHRVVTFRNKSWADDIFDELEYHGFHNARKLISSIENCPEHWHDNYMIATLPRHASLRQKLLGEGRVTQKYLDECVHNFLRFKGARSKEIGCTVLVDDIPTWVMPGVNENGIAFVHALDPIHS